MLYFDHKKERLDKKKGIFRSPIPLNKQASLFA